MVILFRFVALSVSLIQKVSPFQNEGPSSDPKACPGYNASAAAIRRRTPMRPGQPQTRLVTWADNKGPKSVCLAHADVISFNGYPAWYDPILKPAECAKTWGPKVAWAKLHFPDKPFTVRSTYFIGLCTRVLLT